MLFDPVLRFTTPSSRIHAGPHPPLVRVPAMHSRMRRLRGFLAAAPLAVLLLHAAAGAQSCPSGSTLQGAVRDSTAAMIPGAEVTLDGKLSHKSGPDGHFGFTCVPPGRHQLTATYDGFAPATLEVTLPPAVVNLAFTLLPAAQASVTVESDDVSQVAPPGGGNAITLAGKQLDALADDPDDLLRELQQLAAASGGNPANTTISVDGFQDSAQVPPKDSIAFINVSPDIFSAEYREPPFSGARVEIFTKPGAKAFHGALFATNSSSFMNARDPFTTTTGSIGKQRYGFDLTGPVRKQGSNFRLTLEHRSIDETVAVDAITPDANGNPVNTLDTVPIPQRLWEGNARLDWQFGPKNFAFVSFAANVRHFENQGVGGQTLREAGYDAGQNDFTIDASNVTTISPQLVHEARASYEHYTITDIPNSTAPSLQVSGFFTGGGASIGNDRDLRSRIEYDDDFILTTKKHLIKSGVQLLYYYRSADATLNFNGTYIFSGFQPANPAAPYVSALQQYQQAITQPGQPGSTATEFNNVAGNPHVLVSQVRFSAFFQDNIKFNPHWSLFYGLRYFLETDPANFNSIAPRAGFAYTPDKKQTWVLKGHVGLFDGEYPSDDALELHREDGIQRITSLIYNPVYGNAFTGATPIHAERTLAPGFDQGVYLIGEVSVSKDLPFGFNINAQTVFLRFLTDGRTVNVNQPLNGSPFGPRPFAPNLDILQAQNSGSGQGHGDFVGLSNFKRKRVQFFLGALHMDIRDNTDDRLFFQPQSAYTDAGETVRRTGNSLWSLFGNVNIALPYKLSLAGTGYANGGSPFNLLTGADNNGDGNFNDRPQYAPAGSVANGTTIFNTPMGLLTNAGAIVNGIPVAPIQRNLGALPWSFHIDANLQRAFKLTRDSKAAHPQSITINARSANFLNHTNVTAEGSVLGTPQFLIPVAADTARRPRVRPPLQLLKQLRGKTISYSYPAKS